MATRPAFEVVYNISQVARIFRLSPRAIRELIREGELPAIRLGRHYRVPKSVIDTFFSQSTPVTFQPEDLGFGLWKKRRNIRDGVTEVNRIRNRNRKTLKQTIAELEAWRD